MEKLSENISLKGYHTFHAEVKTRYFYQYSTQKEIVQFTRDKLKKFPRFLILGGGSNVLFREDFDGIIIHPANKGIQKLDEGDDFVDVEVAAGEDWDAFVKHAVTMKWGGIENLSYIPGYVGSSPIQNIGAYGVEVKDVIKKVTFLDISNKKIHVFNNSQCNFGYRNSIFKQEFKGKIIILSVTFRLLKNPTFTLHYGQVGEMAERLGGITLENIRKAIIHIRETKLPHPDEFGNAGSFFKNPVIEESQAKDILKEFPLAPIFDFTGNKKKIPASWLIDKSNWNGIRIGYTGTWSKQPLVIVNYKNATGKEIYNFALNVHEAVLKRFNIKLEMEGNII